MSLVEAARDVVRLRKEFMFLCETDADSDDKRRCLDAYSLAMLRLEAAVSRGDTMKEALATTAGNIKSLRAAHGNCSTYDTWLETVEKARDS